MLNISVIGSPCFNSIWWFTKHAAAYRQFLYYYAALWTWSLSGDVFYAHARLLERACKLNRLLVKVFNCFTYRWNSGGDLSGYIPTNVISITDGQIFMEKDLFFKGIRPAVNVGSSVSRVVLKLSHIIKTRYWFFTLWVAQYREYSVFASSILT